MEDYVFLLREKLKIGESALRLAYFEEGNAHQNLLGRTALMDEALTQLFQLWVKNLPLQFSPALVAVGGYGRGELFPHSDIDLFILIPNDSASTYLENFIAQLWNLGVHIAHRVSTPSQALKSAQENVATQTLLWEGRFLAGNRTLFLSFQRRLFSLTDSLDFLRLKRFEQEERHQRFQNTPYNLEPNLKESPGALRDLHAVIWLSNIAGFGKNWKELSQNGFLSPAGLKIAENAKDFLTHLRIRLHYLTHKAEERLLLDYQESLAKSFHWEGLSPADSASRLMRHYYQNAKVVMLLGDILTKAIFNAADPESIPGAQKIDEDFQSVGDVLEINDPLLFQKKPALIFTAFLKMQTLPHLNAMSAALLRALWHARFQIGDAFRKNEENKSLFLQLFQAEQHVTRELARLNQLGLLGAYIPAFEKIIGQMQYDLFHAYTVDQHSFQVCRYLENFKKEEFAHEYPLMSSLMDAFAFPHLLYCAALFHDIGKGQGGDHAEIGAVETQKFCALHPFKKEESDLVVWLVRNHLKMSQVAQKEDLANVETIREFAHWVGDLTHLNALYLLTHADIRATNPKIWSAWKAKLLEDLYFLTRDVLLQKEETPSPSGLVEKRKAAVLKNLENSFSQNAFWESLDAVYFMRHTPDEILWHTRALQHQWEKNTPVVSARLMSDSLQVMIYTPDSEDLFTRLVGLFARHNFLVLEAKIHTTLKHYALDTFILLDSEKQNLNKKDLKNMERWIIQVLNHPFKEAFLPITQTRLPRQLKYFPLKPNITLFADANKIFYRLYITTADRPGLLYLIANELRKARVNLHSARIATMGDRAEDVFLISGEYLNEEAFRLKLEKALMEAIQI